MSERVTKQDLRRGRFKKAIDRDEARRQREDTMVGIRKAKREENLMKKRREKMGASSFGTPNDIDISATDSNNSLAATLYARMPQMVAGVLSDNPQDQVQHTLEFRRLLSIERNPPIEEVIAQNVVPRFVEFLSDDSNPQLQFEAAWSLTNIASGTSSHTRVVIDNGAVPVFVYLLNSPNDDVREQAVWALGNIAGDSSKCRDLVLDSGALHPLLMQLTADSKVTMLRNASWTLSNLCRGKPAPKFELVKPALETLAHLIYYDDEEVLTDACWALSYLSDGSNDKIKAVVESGVVKRLVELLLHQNVSVQTPSLRTVGNIVTGNDVQTQFVINVSALPCLLNLLNSPKKSIRKEACWTISNITAGNQEQINAVLEANLVPPLIDILTNADFDVKKEAAWAISNATSGGTPDQVKYLVQQGCLEPLCNLLVIHDARIISVALEGLENILRKGQRERDTTGAEYNDYARAIEAVGGLDKIEALQHHSNEEVYEKAVRLLEVFFLAEDEIDGVVPDQSASQFGFGVDPAPDGGFNFGAPTAAPAQTGAGFDAHPAGVFGAQGGSGFGAPTGTGFGAQTGGFGGTEQQGFGQ
ncbi:Predicted protein [Chondrus crispus]|uniref:Importin subunit alpha n=1 Tax=Chondrus crispus TaxID=2769 RepID=R7QQU3_CHOCR|nr:Predicted protein [Chondrus crispus]CDF39856.1 Predicted protein [Chondrus crispus]|eukprot:XP_005710150.1 Predicted protein [Chondrus crispus]